MRLKSGNWSQILFLLPLVIAIVVVFFPVLGNGFTNWDDPAYVVNNPLVRNFSIRRIPEFFTTLCQEKYQPLTVLSFAFDSLLNGDGPQGYHRTDLLLHILNAILIFFLLRRLALSPGFAFGVALIWSIHPLQVESVAWVASRQVLLFAFFFLLSLLSYPHAASKSDLLCRGRYFLTFLFFILSLLSMSMAVTLPIVLWLMDWYDRHPRRYVFSKGLIPFFFVSIGYGVAVLVLTHRAQAFPFSVAYTLFDRITFSVLAVLLYGIKFICPVGLSCFYPLPVIRSSDFLLALGGIAVAVYVSIRTFRSIPAKVILGLGIFLGILLPGLHLLVVNDSLISERAMYLPLLGLLLAVAVLVQHFWDRMPGLGRMVMLFLWGAYVIFLGVLSFQRCGVWRDSEQLWMDVILKHPRAVVAYKNLATHFEATKKFLAAMYCYEKVIFLAPRSADGYFGRGNILAMGGHYQLALEDYNRALNYDASQAGAYNNRGNVLIALGNVDEALRDYNQAIRLNPHNARYYFHRAMCLRKKGELPAAQNDFRRARELASDDPGLLEEILAVESEK